MQLDKSDKNSFRKLMRDVEHQRKLEIQKSSTEQTRIFEIKFLYGASAYNHIWDDSGSGSDLTCSVYTPNVDADDGWYSIGDLVSPINEYPSASTTVPLVLLKLIDPNSDALRPPTGFNLIYTDAGSDAPNDLGVWQPIAPTGYVALGYVVQPNYDTPVRPDFMCVKEDLLDPASVSFVFNDAGSGAVDDLGVWNVFGNSSNSVLSGGFLATPSLTEAPPKASCFAIKANCVLLNGVAYEILLNPVPQIPASAAIDVKLLKGDGELQFKWNDVGTGGSSPTCNFFDASSDQLPNNYFSLGSGGMLESYNPSEWQLCVCADISSNNSSLAPPVGVTQIWADNGSGGDNDGSFWLMQPPEGYVALGIIAQNGYDPPDLTMYRCVKSDLVCGGCVLQNAAWNDVGTGADDDFSAWYLAGADSPSLQANLLAGYNQYSTYPEQVFMLNAAFCSGYNGRFNIIDSTGSLLEKLFETIVVELYQLSYTELKLVWTDAGSGAKDDILMYTINDQLLNEGYKPLGYFGASNGNNVAPARVAKPLPGFENLFQPPITFKNVWMDKIWQPIPPAGFVAMGIIACDETPSISSVWCVQQDLVIPGKFGQYVWSDAGSGKPEDAELHLASIDMAQYRDPIQDAPQTLGTMISVVGMPTCILRQVHCIGDIDDTPPPKIANPVFNAQIALYYELIWADSGSGGENDGSFFNPVLPDGYYFLGSSGQPNYNPASVSALRSVIVSPMEGFEDAFKPASDVFLLQTTRADVTGYFWQPVAPEGYVAMGIVVSGCDTAPDLTNYRCVKQDYVRLGEKDSFIWNDQKTSSDLDISIYSSRTIWNSMCCSAGTLTSVGYYSSPVNLRGYTLCSAFINGGMQLSQDSETSLINTYGPQISYHPDEQYLPVSIEEMLSRVTLSDGTTTISNVTRDTLTQYPSWNMALQPGASRAGSVNTAVGYVHIHYGTLFTDFQFWTLHANNGAGTVEVSSLMGNTAVTTVRTPVPPMGEHEGDWETVILRFANVANGNLPPLVDVGFVSHGDLAWARIEDVQQLGSKVISYSSLNGHGAYREAGYNYSNEGKVAGLVRWRLVNNCSDSGQVLDLSTRFVIAARTYIGMPDSILDTAWNYPGRWGAVTQETLDIRNFVPFIWKALWPIIIEVYLVLIALSMFVPFLGIPLFWATTAALIVAFIPNATNTLLPRIKADESGPMPPPIQNPWNGSM